MLLRGWWWWCCRCRCRRTGCLLRRCYTRVPGRRRGGPRLLRSSTIAAAVVVATTIIVVVPAPVVPSAASVPGDGGTPLAVDLGEESPRREVCVGHFGRAAIQEPARGLAGFVCVLPSAFGRVLVRIESSVSVVRVCLQAPRALKKRKVLLLGSGDSSRPCGNEGLREETKTAREGLPEVEEENERGKKGPLGPVRSYRDHECDAREVATGNVSRCL